MLQTVEGVIDVDGAIYLSEPLLVIKPSRVLVILLDEKYEIPTLDEVEALKSLHHNRPLTTDRSGKQFTEE